MENLSKENTWNELEIQFPEEMEDFFDWIEAYKQRANWSRLFNPAFFSVYVSGHAQTKITNDSPPKFHDIPFEMQVGVIISYFSELEVLNNAVFEACSSTARFKIFLQDRFNMIKILNGLQP